MRPLTTKLLLAGALISLGCLDLHKTGPEDPTPVVRPMLVDVTVEYRQPNVCVSSSNCADNVAFLASWMPLGQGILLQRVNTFAWQGVAHNVPVNYPPKDDPYVVAIYDPYLRDTELGGVTAGRLIVGGQNLTSLVTVEDTAGRPHESAFVYIDENGFGHNPS
ncbi:MAG TPA: hypothetical protein VGN09_15830 [Vicinamibacteria bacterium]